MWPLARAEDVLRKAQADIGFEELKSDTDVVKLSIIGVGMRSHAGVAQKMFQTLADKGIKAILDDQHLRNGLNVHKGRITNGAVADALGYELAEPKVVLAAGLGSGSADPLPLHSAG